MKQGGSPEGEKSEKPYGNKRQSSADQRQNLVTLDNTRKELIRIEKNCEMNRIKYDYLSGKKVKQLVQEYLNGLHDDIDKNENVHEIKLSGTIEILRGALKSSPAKSNTSSAMVCWSSSSNDYNLEVFGSLYISPRNTIVPLEPDEISQQKFIHLG